MSQYKGIDGVLFCAGDDCGVENVVEGTTSPPLLPS